jgi:carbonic anhydrase
MKTQTKELQEKLIPIDALQLLIDGNNRFVKSEMIERDLNEQVSITSKGQYPLAVVLSCIDSRVPAELVFDQGIGDIFSVRVAGNIINEDVLGSIEYGCKVAGSKVVVVLGHSKCGAVTAACNNVVLGNITPLLSKINPAVKIVRTSEDKMTNEEIEKTSIVNVELSIERMRKESPILNEMEKEGLIKIVGASYDVSSGKVHFL